MPDPGHERRWLNQNREARVNTIDHEDDDRWRSLRSLIDSAPTGSSVAVTVRHLETDSTFSHLGERRFAAASTIKLLILIAVARAIDAGTLDLSATIVPDPGTIVGGSGVLNWLSRDLAPTIADHAWLMIAVSDNTASNVLIDAIGFPAVREAQRDLRLTETELHGHFMSAKRRPEDPANSVSASDLTRMLEVIATDRAASPERCAWIRSLLGDQQYRDGIARHLPPGVAYAGKTGWQSGVAHDCGLLTGPGGTIALAVLTEGYAEPYPAHILMGSIGKLVAQVIA